MALSRRDREEAFDRGWSAAQRQDETGGPSLIGSLVGQLLVLPLELAGTLIADEDREELRQEYERGFRAYQRHSESRPQDDEPGESASYGESESETATYGTSTAGKRYSEPAVPATAVGAPPKSPKRFSRVAIVIATSLALAGAFSIYDYRAGLDRPRPVAIPGYIHADHGAVLEAWLDRNSRFRVATDADCGCADEMPVILQNSNNDQLYYAEEDLDDDGHDDFAVVLVDTTKPLEEFNAALAIFSGPFSRGMQPALLEEGIGHPVGAVLFRNPDEGTLAVCKWESSCSVVMIGDRGYSLELSPE